MAADSSEGLPGDAEQLQLLSSAIADYAVWLLDATGRVASWNIGAERFQGYAPADVVGRDFAIFFTPEDQASARPQSVLAAARRDGRLETESWSVRKDGSRFWARRVIEAVRNEGGAVTGFVTITRNMTDRMESQEALRESERRFRLLVRGVVDYAIFMLDPDGIVTNWNPGAQRIKGYAAEEIVGHHFSRFYTDEDRQRGVPQQALARARREGKYEAEGWRMRKDGTRFWASVVIDAIRDETGTLIGFAKVTRDISAQRAAQEALENTRAALAQAQKMEAIGQLTGGVAHDFNNLLTVVISNLDLILQDPSDAMRTERLAQGAQRAAERGARLTRQLLAFARRQPLRPELVELNPLIAGFQAVLRRACGDAVDLELHLGNVVRAVNIDAAQFEAALLNLVLNARDAMGEGGVLRVATETVEVASGDPVAIEGLAPGSYAAVTVHDTGCGMSPEVLRRAIEPFFTTKETGRGTGLGLSQVYGFVNQSGGHMSIDSAVGRGTTVRLLLPAARTTALREPRKQRAGIVLVVEDDPDVLQSTVEMVRGLGYDVLTAGDALDALTLLKRNLPIDVLFSDIVMPRGMNGVELAREARKLRPELRVVLSSGYASSVLSAEHGLTADFAFIGKPYRWPDLAEKLRGGRVN